MIWYPLSKFLQSTYKILLVDYQISASCVPDSYFTVAVI